MPYILLILANISYSMFKFHFSSKMSLILWISHSRKKPHYWQSVVPLWLVVSNGFISNSHGFR
jgi:hypothetical protein